MSTLVSAIQPRNLVIAVVVLVVILAAAVSSLGGSKSDNAPSRGRRGTTTYEQPSTIEVPTADSNWGSGS